VKIQAKYFVGIAFISASVIVHIIFKVRKIEYNSDNIAIAFLLSCFVAAPLSFFLAKRFGSLDSLIISSIIYALVYLKVLLS
jgi:hypothetical protein